MAQMLCLNFNRICLLLFFVFVFSKAGMLVNVYVETFNIDVMVFVGKVTMHLRSQQFSVSDSVCDNDMTVATCGAG
jgi:hypothetical protein